MLSDATFTTGHGQSSSDRTEEGGQRVSTRHQGDTGGEDNEVCGH